MEIMVKRRAVLDSSNGEYGCGCICVDCIDGFRKDIDNGKA